MTQAKYTPAPWALTHYGMASTPDWQIHSGGNLICNLAETNTRNAQEMSANARLIAAAPDLLEALKAAMANLRYHTGDKPDFDEVFAPELAAIAKAEGK